MWHAILVFFGVDNEAGKGYAFWSGIGCDLGIFGAIVAVYWKHTCHVHHCLRWARHPVGDGTLIVCRRHHPAVPNKITPEHVEQAHQDSQC